MVALKADATLNAMPTPPPPSTVAAVDLGSNSFHLVIAQVEHHDLQLVDRRREWIQLAAGLDDEDRLSDEAQQRALACLARFGQRLRDLPAEAVRAVGTDTLRRAKNGRAFLRKAQSVLGAPIEIVPGREEARLIYLGVAHALHDGAARRLVVDIGGGSTECILGEGFEVLEAESLRMGCVSFTKRFFESGGIDRERFRKAEVSAKRELQSIERRLQALGWEGCVGASGTIQSIEESLRVTAPHDGLTLEALKRMRKALVAAGRIDRIDLPALRDDRRAVLPGGLAILISLFESLGIDRMSVSTGAMREGLLYDLMGRIRHEDVRDRTIRRICERYHVDLEQSARVERTALSLLGQVATVWGLDTTWARQELVWAARLHECGLAVTYSGYHKHGAYLVAHSDMPGYSSDDQERLAAMIQGQRRKLTRASFEELAAEPETVLRLTLLLRLAVLLNRSRSPRPLPIIKLAATKTTVRLLFPAGWLAEHPLTGADLEDEASTWNDIGYELELS